MIRDVPKRKQRVRIQSVQCGDCGVMMLAKSRNIMYSLYSEN